MYLYTSHNMRKKEEKNMNYLSKIRQHTMYIWRGSTEIGHKPSTLIFFIRHHLKHHFVRGRNKSARSESPTEATQFLHQVGMAIVNIQIVVSALWVSLQIKNAEGERDQISLWNLETKDSGHE